MTINVLNKLNFNPIFTVDYHQCAGLVQTHMDTEALLDLSPKEK